MSAVEWLTGTPQTRCGGFLSSSPSTAATGKILVVNPRVHAITCHAPRGLGFAMPVVGARINRCVASLHALISGVLCTRALFAEEPFASYTRSIWAMEFGQPYFAGESATLAAVLP